MAHSRSGSGTNNNVTITYEADGQADRNKYRCVVASVETGKWACCTASLQSSDWNNSGTPPVFTLATSRDGLQFTSVAVKKDGVTSRIDDFDKVGGGLDCRRCNSNGNGCSACWIDYDGHKDCWYVGISLDGAGDGDVTCRS